MSVTDVYGHNKLVHNDAVDALARVGAANKTVRPKGPTDDGPRVRRQTHTRTQGVKRQAAVQVSDSDSGSAKPIIICHRRREMRNAPMDIPDPEQTRGKTRGRQSTEAQCIPTNQAVYKVPQRTATGMNRAWIESPPSRGNWQLAHTYTHWVCASSSAAACPAAPVGVHDVRGCPMWPLAQQSQTPLPPKIKSLIKVLHPSPAARGRAGDEPVSFRSRSHT